MYISTAWSPTACTRSRAVRAADDDLDIDPALAACVQLSLAGPHLAPGSQPAAPPPMTVSDFGMNLHAATTADGRDRK